MYQGCEFVFAGVPSSMYGLYLYDIAGKGQKDTPFGNAANIVETRLPNRVTPIHYGVRYNDTPLSFTLVFGSDKELDRYQLQQVADWLTGYQDYQWLSIVQPDLVSIQYRCLIRTLTPISIGWAPVAFEADVICDTPYGYGEPFSASYTVLGEEKNFLFYNDGTCKEALYPVFDLEIASAPSAFAIVNKTTKQSMEFVSIPAGVTRIHIDNENQILTCDGGVNPYEFFNFKFVGFAKGQNNITLVGNGKLTITGRFRYNVGS